MSLHSFNADDFEYDPDRGKSDAFLDRPLRLNIKEKVRPRKVPNKPRLVLPKSVSHDQTSKKFYDQPRAHEITWAVQRNNFHEVVRIIEDDPESVNYVDEDYYSPLHWAARKGLRRIAELLLSAGADIDGEDRYNQTPLHWAAWNGRLTLLKLLINHGANINARDSKLCTPLYNSCFIGHLKCVKELIKSGANIELCDDKNRPPERVICKWTYANDRMKDAIQELVHIKDDFDEDDTQNIDDIDEDFFDKNDVNSYITRREKVLKKEEIASVKYTDLCQKFNKKANESVSANKAPRMTLDKAKFLANILPSAEKEFDTTLPKVRQNLDLIPSASEDVTLEKKLANIRLRNSNIRDTTDIKDTAEELVAIARSDQQRRNSRHQKKSLIELQQANGLQINPTMLIATLETLVAEEEDIAIYIDDILTFIILILIQMYTSALVMGVLNIIPSVIRSVEIENPSCDVSEVDYINLLQHTLKWPQENANTIRKDVFRYYVFQRQSVIKDFEVFQKSFETCLSDCIDTRISVYRFESKGRKVPNQVSQNLLKQCKLLHMLTGYKDRTKFIFDSQDSLSDLKIKAKDKIFEDGVKEVNGNKELSSSSSNLKIKRSESLPSSSVSQKCSTETSTENENKRKASYGNHRYVIYKGRNVTRKPGQYSDRLILLPKRKGIEELCRSPTAIDRSKLSHLPVHRQISTNPNLLKKIDKMNTLSNPQAALKAREAKVKDDAILAAYTFQRRAV